MSTPVRITFKPAVRRPRVAISACLLGHKVRHDGDHKRADLLVETLARACDLVPICPEVEIGLGVPRPPIRLLRIDGKVCARGVDSPGPDGSVLDPTEALIHYAEHMAATLDVDGYVFKARSPSCGVHSTPIADVLGAEVGPGLFAVTFMARRPDVRVAEEGDLDDPARIAAWIKAL